MTEIIYDTLIIGAGPAGLSAALYSGRRGLKTALISKDLGGQVNWAGNIENYPGFLSISGIDLIKNLNSNIKNLDVDLKLNEEVTDIVKKNNIFEVNTISKAKYKSKTVIICAGKVPRRLEIPGEKEFEKKGVAFCATCDAPFFKDKDVAVIGGANSALDAILQLDHYASKIYVILRSKDFSGEQIRAEKIKKMKKVEILIDTVVEKIDGDKFVKSIVTRNLLNSSKRIIDLLGVFIEVGSLPATGFISNILKLNEKGEISISNKNEVHKKDGKIFEGVFAAGDITSDGYKQITIAVGEGAKAALSCAEFITKSKLN